jgi:hypothetical protein
MHNKYGHRYRNQQIHKSPILTIITQIFLFIYKKFIVDSPLLYLSEIPINKETPEEVSEEMQSLLARL